MINPTPPPHVSATAKAPWLYACSFIAGADPGIREGSSKREVRRNFQTDKQKKNGGGGVKTDERPGFAIGHIN